MIIESGSGGNNASVTDKKEVYTFGAKKTILEDAVENETCFSFTAAALAATGADDCVMYIENGEDDDLVIDEISMGKAAAAVTIYLRSGVKAASALSSPTTITPVNSFVGSTKSLSDSTIQKGADLNNGSVLAHTNEHNRWYITATSLDSVKNVGVRIPKGKAVSLWSDAAQAVTYNVKMHLEVSR